MHRIVQVQRQMLTHCASRATGWRSSMLCRQATTAAVLDATRPADDRAGEPVNGALYYPWLRTVERAIWCRRAVTSRASFARTDARVGVFKAPANEEVVRRSRPGDRHRRQHPGPAQSGRRQLPARVSGRGIRVWGARTLSRDPDWRYVNVRRLFLTLRRWIDLNMAWATFEPNEPRLWVRIQRELTTYLTNLLRDGALRAPRPTQAFYVKCDAETNPPDLRERRTGRHRDRPGADRPGGIHRRAHHPSRRRDEVQLIECRQSAANAASPAES